MRLRGDGLTVNFGGVRALEDASVDVPEAAITALVGPNGAGKTTFFNCLTGFVQPDAGRVLVGDQDFTHLPPHERARAGMARAFQTPRVDVESRALDAVALGYYSTYQPPLFASLLGLPAVRKREAEIENAAHDALRLVGLDGQASDRLDRLSLAQLRLVELARALVSEPRYLLLDEPAAGLSTADRDSLATVLAEVASGGVGVLLIEHNFHFVSRVSDTVSVLAQGQLIFSGTPQEVGASDVVRKAYLSTEPVQRSESA